MIERHLVDRDGVRLAYARRGVGRPIALIHGLGLAGDDWGALPERLAARGYTVVTPDARGTGASDAPPPPYRMRDLADDLAAVLRTARVRPAVVVGISLGGMIAQHLALRHPDAVAGLVLAATTCGPPFGRPVGPVAAAALLASLVLPPRWSRIHQMLAHPASLQEQPNLLEPIEAAIRACPPQKRRNGFLGQLAAATLHTTGHRLGRIRVPTEVIVGETDRIIPTINARILAQRIPGARLTVVPRTGHVFPLESPAAFEESIVRVAEAAFGGPARGGHSAAMAPACCRAEDECASRRPTGDFPLDRD